MAVLTSYLARVMLRVPNPNPNPNPNQVPRRRDAAGRASLTLTLTLTRYLAGVMLRVEHLGEDRVMPLLKQGALRS